MIDSDVWELGDINSVFLMKHGVYDTVRLKYSGVQCTVKGLYVAELFDE